MIIRNGQVYQSGQWIKTDCYLDERGILVLSDIINSADEEEIDVSGCLIIPGLIDPHVHLREPGYEYKETIATGTAAAAKGGFTTVLAMPNTSPVIDNPAMIKKEKALIAKSALVEVLPYSAVTKNQTGNELVDFSALSQETRFFSDDGQGIQSAEIMKQAMLEIKKFDGLLAAHCQDTRLSKNGIVHQGKFAKDQGYPGISSASEYRQVQRDLQLALQTGCRYHICHLSTKESVQLLKEYKALGARVSGEVTVHHLLLCQDDIVVGDANFKMNPPLRSKADRTALQRGLAEGVIDMIATDHAPHSPAEKSRSFAESLMGVVGLEDAFSLCYSYLVKPGLLSLERLIDCLSVNCAEIFGIRGGELKSLEPANFTIIDLNSQARIDRHKLVSKGKNTPFHHWEVAGLPLFTFINGKIVYRRTVKK